MSIGKDTKCKNTIPIDFGVFQNKDTKSQSTVECKSIQRIISELLYYQNLTNKANHDDNYCGKQIFRDFLCLSYTHF